MQKSRKILKNVMILLLIIIVLVMISFVIFSYVTLNNDGIPSEELINHQYLSVNEDYTLSVFPDSAIYKTPEKVIVFDTVSYNENFIIASSGDGTYTFLVLERDIIFNSNDNVYLYVWEIKY